MNAVTMREPRQIPESARPHGRGRVQPNPALPNLIVVEPVGRWPVGAIVPKEALPHGFLGHLEMGVVVETDRPATHATTLARPAAAGGAADPAHEVARLRGVAADAEGRLAALAAELAGRDATIATLRADLAAAEDLVRQLSEARDRVEGAGADGGLVAVVAAQAPAGLPVVKAPWAG